MKWRCDHRSCDCNLGNSKVSLKNVFGASTGFEPMASALKSGKTNTDRVKFQVLYVLGTLADITDRKLVNPNIIENLNQKCPLAHWVWVWVFPGID